LLISFSIEEILMDKKKILIIEDNPADAELAIREIKKGFGPGEFLIVDNSDDFMTALENFTPDIIISDYMLPDFDGMTALQLAIKQVPEVPFIVLTGSMNEDTAVTCMKTGAWDYVIKEHIKRLGPAVAAAMEEKEVRRERYLARLEVEKAYKVKKEFLANISHELRTPLNGILGMFQILETLDLGSDEKYWLSMAKHSADNLKKIVIDLLDFIQLDSGTLNIEKAVFSIDELVNSVLYLFKKEAEGGELRIEYSNRCSRPVFSGDKSGIAQIIWNLVSNAVKFSSEGRISVVIAEGANGLVIVVEDEGEGIDEDRINDIFLPLEQLENPYTKAHPGIGLGLAIVKNIIDLMNGEIKVSSTPGRGSRFEVSVPGEFSDEASAAGKTGNPSGTGKGADGTILVVEDEAINRLYVSALLKKRGYRVYEADNGIKAVDMALSLRPDLILMDIGLPEMDGLEASKKIIAANGEGGPPIIALTAHAHPDEIKRFIAGGMSEVVTKPYNENELIEAVGRCL
jgi:two-component system sensor histidine kinase EvgS